MMFWCERARTFSRLFNNDENIVWLAWGGQKMTQLSSAIVIVINVDIRIFTIGLVEF